MFERIRDFIEEIFRVWGPIKYDKMDFSFIDREWEADYIHYNQHKKQDRDLKNDIIFLNSNGLKISGKEIEVN
jgi:uncharacterized Rmd1/YagE family protein